MLCSAILWLACSGEPGDPDASPPTETVPRGDETGASGATGAVTDTADTETFHVGLILDVVDQTAVGTGGWVVVNPKL